MRSTRVGAWVVMGIAFLAVWLYAGQLTPPAGPVGPTMKTLDDLSAEHATILGSLGGGGSGAIKRVIHGILEFPAGQYSASETLTPAINPAKSVVMLDPTVYVSYETVSPMSSRTGGCVTSLTSTQVTIMVDNTNGFARRLSFQIIEYY